MLKKTIAAAAMLAASCMPALAGTAAHPAYHLHVPGRHITLPPQAPTAKTMLYYGGSVFSNVQVVSVMWSNSVARTTIRKIGPFLKSIANSTYVDQLAQYGTDIVAVNGMQGTDQTIGRGTYLGQFVITPANTSKKLTDGDVQVELAAQIGAGKLPASNLNVLYMIYFPQDITISLDGLTSCQQFGAYHEAVSSTVTPNNLFYGVMPDCGGGFGANLTVASSHEFAEATTDNIPTPGSNPAYPQAWNSDQGYEIGDLCEGINTTLTTKFKTYTVQEVFDNTTNKCATGKFTSP